MRTSFGSIAIVVVLSLAGAAACGTTAADRARDVAADRLHCPSSAIVTTPRPDLPGDTFEATGCGSREICQYVNTTREGGKRLGAGRGIAVRCTSLASPTRNTATR